MTGTDHRGQHTSHMWDRPSQTTNSMGASKRGCRGQARCQAAKLAQVTRGAENITDAGNRENSRNSTDIRSN